MKKILTLCCVVALAACQKPADPEAPEAPISQAPQAPGQGLRIAYVELDSLMTNYQLCIDLTALASQEAENIQRTLAQKQRALEQHAAAMQQKYETGGYTSQEEVERASQALQREQQELEELSARLSNSFAQQQAEYNQQMHDSIENFIRSYNRNGKYDFILTRAADNMLYANPALDITDQTIKALNKRYKPTAEMSEQLKSKQTAKQ